MTSRALAPIHAKYLYLGSLDSSQTDTDLQKVVESVNRQGRDFGLECY